MDMRETLLQVQKLAIKLAAKEMLERAEKATDPGNISVETDVSHFTGRAYTEITVNGPNGESLHVMMWGPRP